jgi:hypothetical protein
MDIISLITGATCVVAALATMLAIAKLVHSAFVSNRNKPL